MMINIKRSRTGNFQITTPHPPVQGRERAMELLGLIAVAYTNGETHYQSTVRPVAVRYKQPRTQFITLN